LGKRVEVEHGIGSHDVLAARNVRHEGRAAGGHQQVARGVALAVDLDRVAVDQLRPAGDERDARIFQQRAVDAVEPRDLFGALCLEVGPVELRRLGQRPAVARGFLERFGVTGRVAVELLRNAAHVDAGAAQLGRFGQPHAGTGLRGHARGAHAAAAAADDEEIEVECAHEKLLGRPL
jgi:hypothetical protein